ncbi:peptide ABC transporter substrate-binding protein [Ktedonosporobacter rubrisoli]|uniref:Peptide ABC transporter substrate-binding protein n=1 Tax=Ktedonosporobacter rubrisoli TaxID=2509675 RepID=A0A4P6K3R6_KTERU|nr:peptide ABC transporter substrate-binding protein [Ktedonosporobacter rubrisoli]QBD82136.1 peptide ABC transporter substrate-binding protein [Ktedonosporobacter rubrisoli]
MKPTSKALLPVFFLLTLLIAACGGGNSSTSTAPSTAHTKAPENKQVLITTIPTASIANFDSLDPAKATDFYSASAINMIYSGLVVLDDNLKVQPELAKSWDKSADGLSYTFHLKPNLKFSDGTPLTSHDVAYSIDRAFQPQLKSPTAAYYLKYIKDQEKVNNGQMKTLIGDSLITPDDNTITIKLSKPIAYFLDSLAFQCSFVVEKSLVQKYGEFTSKFTDHLSEGGGSGPFKVKSYMLNKDIDMIPNPNYFGAQPQLKEVIAPFYKDADTTRKDYLVNRLDDATIPLSNFASDKHRSDFHQQPFLTISYYAMNYNQKPFDNTKIRQAFALAINKDLITSKIWKGSYIPTNHIVPQGQYGYDPALTGPAGVKGTAGDPQKAKELFQQGLQEDGYSSASQLPPITLTYASGGVQAARDEVASMQQMWQQVLGVNVKTSDIDLNAIFNDESLGANNPLQFYAGPSWVADYPDPQDWTTLQFDKGAAQNNMNFGQNKGPDAMAQQAIQAQMEQADVIQDPNARLAAVNKIEQALVNYVAWLPIEQQTTVLLRKPCVQGAAQNAQGLIDPEDWGKVYISTDTPCTSATVSS